MGRATLWAGLKGINSFVVICNIEWCLTTIESLHWPPATSLPIIHGFLPSHPTDTQKRSCFQACKNDYNWTLVMADWLVSMSEALTLCMTGHMLFCIKKVRPKKNNSCIRLATNFWNVFRLREETPVTLANPSHKPKDWKSEFFRISFFAT